MRKRTTLNDRQIDRLAFELWCIDRSESGTWIDLPRDPGDERSIREQEQTKIEERLRKALTACGLKVTYDREASE